MNYCMKFYSSLGVQKCDVYEKAVFNDGKDLLLCTLSYSEHHGWNGVTPTIYKTDIMPYVEREWQAHLLSLITRA
jgi:hypothetical protein